MINFHRFTLFVKLCTLLFFFLELILRAFQITQAPHSHLQLNKTIKIISLIGDKQEAWPFKANCTANFEDGS